VISPNLVRMRLEVLVK